MPEALKHKCLYSLQHTHSLLILARSHPSGSVGPFERRGQSSCRLWSLHDTSAWHHECHQSAAGDCCGGLVANGIFTKSQLFYGLYVVVVFCSDLSPGKALIPLQALSPVGRCKTFDASGNGYGRGDGCIVATMVPGTTASDAYALVHSTVVNQDGRSSSLTAPNGSSQTSLVAAALVSAGAPARFCSLPTGLDDLSTAAHTLTLSP